MFFLSSITRPSLSVIIRLAITATSLLCVTTIRLIFLFWFKSFRSAIISFAFFESRFPVGSSARRSEGHWKIALAIAARCCCPPESALGKSFSLPLSPTECSIYASLCSSTSPPSSSIGRVILSLTLSSGTRL